MTSNKQIDGVNLNSGVMIFFISKIMAKYWSILF